MAKAKAQTISLFFVLFLYASLSVWKRLALRETAGALERKAKKIDNSTLNNS